MNKILVTRSSIPEMEEYIDEIREIWDTHWLTNMGVKHRELQEKLCEYLQVPHTELFTNGHMALEMSLQALDLEGEVITTPFTFSSTTHAIVRNGLKPVFCDIREDDYTLDAEKIEELDAETREHNAERLYEEIRPEKSRAVWAEILGQEGEKR